MVVLLVSPDELIRDTVSDMLTILGHRAIAVKNELLALGALTAIRVDACLWLDARALERAASFMHQARLLQPHVNFIAEESSAQRSSVGMLVRQFISKPFDVYALAKSISKVCY